MSDSSIAASPDEAETALLSKDAYISADYAARERERLWPKTWQVACREEEIPAPGDYLTYDVAHESITVVRGGDGVIRAFHNACQHRGRRLTEGCGHAKLITCPFHGWSYDLEGRSRFVLDRGDFPHLHDEDVRLQGVHVGTWGGFVFVNMAVNPTPLAKYLDPVPSYLDVFEIERLRFRWYVTLELDCNWKVATEAFNEAYHVSQTHRQLGPYADYHTVAHAYGDHGMYERAASATRGAKTHSNDGAPLDVRTTIIEYMRILAEDTRAMISLRDLEASSRVLTEVPANASAAEVMSRIIDFQKEAAIASGVGWPKVGPEEIRRAGIGWHVFPNLVFLPFPSGALAYRARPNGDDPGKCIFDMWALQRYAPGLEPKLNRLYFEDWQDFADMPPFLAQDFQNIPQVQRGMHSTGFKGSRLNAVQERVIANFHRALSDWLGHAAG